MDSSDSSGEKLPKRELQGPRPAPLKVRKDSHKIRKPPVAPPPPPQLPPQPVQQQHRPPVIIYTVSPKIIHADPSEFMTLVQRLTGSNSTSAAAAAGTATSSSSSSSSLVDSTKDTNVGSSSAVSPAARFATIEKAARSPEGTRPPEGVELSGGRGGSFPGILSPGPGSLQPIPAGFFASPSTDPSGFGFLPDFSPAAFGNRNYVDGGGGGFMVMASPSAFFSPQTSSSPTPSLDLFNNFSDP